MTYWNGFLEMAWWLSASSLTLLHCNLSLNTPMRRLSVGVLWAQDFSLPLACVMGACSFEAYNVPYETHGIKQVDADGAEVVYMDRDFLSSIIQGVMQVWMGHALSEVPDLFIASTAALPPPPPPQSTEHLQLLAATGLLMRPLAGISHRMGPTHGAAFLSKSIGRIRSLAVCCDEVSDRGDCLSLSTDLPQ